MFNKLLIPVKNSKRWMSSLTGTSRNIQVTLLGICGRVGGALSLLLKQNMYVTRLHLYDEAVYSPGVSLDVSHIESKTRVYSFNGSDNLDKALEGASIVVIVPANDKQTLPTEEECLFNISGRIFFKRMQHVAKVCPESLICVCVDPLNRMMPIATEVMRTLACYDPRKIFGVTTLNVVRANTFAAREIGVNPLDVNVPVIGGHKGRTVVPLFSQCTPCFDGCSSLFHRLVRRVQCAEELVEQKGQTDGVGGPKLAQAYAVARFVYALCCGLAQRPGVVECALVRSTVYPGIPYLASPVELGRHGVVKNLGIPVINKQEEALVEIALTQLKKDITEGEKYATRQIELLKMQ